ncbi:unnamed protein product [Clonostachys solani]|uniref:Uncharacterized protein n=1 Tax=Clonostachys solani TaxID=160281 RepID=A0A9P0ENI1_9HYPO|nr:unnamed protein product [Clonostachys solani]
MTMDKIRFGVEFEMVVRPKEEVIPLLVEYFGFDLTEHEDVVPKAAWRFTNRDSVLRFFRYYLQQGEQDGYANAGPEVGNYTAWSVVDDLSIKEEHFTYGIELVSPVFTSNIGPCLRDATGDWQYELVKLWAKIENYFDIVTVSSHHCGTHIHQPYAMPNFQVRPEPTMDGLKEAPLEDLVESMMPRREDFGENGVIAAANTDIQILTFRRFFSQSFTMAPSKPGTYTESVEVRDSANGVPHEAGIKKPKAKAKAKSLPLEADLVAKVAKNTKGETVPVSEGSEQFFLNKRDNLLALGLAKERDFRALEKAYLAEEERILAAADKCDEQAKEAKEANAPLGEKNFLVSNEPFSCSSFRITTTSLYSNYGPTPVVVHKPSRDCVMKVDALFPLLNYHLYDGPFQSPILSLAVLAVNSATSIGIWYKLRRYPGYMSALAKFALIIASEKAQLSPPIRSGAGERRLFSGKELTLNQLLDQTLRGVTYRTEDALHDIPMAVVHRWQGASFTNMPA